MWSISTQRLLRAQDGLNIQAHRARLEERLLELEAEARAIKYYQNTLASINRLPPEILYMIFLIVAERTQNQFNPSSCRGPYVDMSWLPRTTQVCRRWRDVALSWPTLWSRISFTTPELTELMLLRSKDTPISIIFETGKEGCPRHILNALVAHSHRLKAIELQGNTKPGDLDDLLSHCSGPMPILESLRLGDQHGWGFKFPGSSFPNGTPALKYLKAHGCEISSWKDLPLGTNLTTLYLGTYPGSGRPTIQELHRCLQRVPSLLTLQLMYFLPNDLQGDLRPFDRLPPVLPKLREMWFIDDVRPLSTFFRAFYVPSSTSLEIICNQESDGNLSGDDLIRLLSSAWDRVIKSGCQSIGVRQGQNDFDPRRRIYDMCFNYHQDEGQIKENQDLCINIRLDVDNVLLCFKRWFDLSSVRSFTGDGVVLWDTTCAIFRDLAQLAEIHLKSTVIGGFIGLVADQPAAFPAFSSLYLENVDFRHYNPGIMHGFGDIDRDGTYVATLLVESLRHRSMKKVSIEHCYNFEQSHWEMMQEHLPGVEIIWDGYERLLASDEPGEPSEEEEEGSGEEQDD
ncbi:hypothetical protein DFP72DRAFT_922271 [Ephemerocybe angulata]|uniref:F-box domain-containing protein n=1 Tax=Ephemerocybe angulata TaxID=980116 RepID=A0A8H6HI34_9AGAR|nr:hypothetical protein DFP72DRAFT_922271 [Tulosesus angulatus]